MWLAPDYEPFILLLAVAGAAAAYFLYQLCTVPDINRGYTVKKGSGFPVPSRDVTYKTLPGRE
jgi:hypothetical protein